MTHGFGRHAFGAGFIVLGALMLCWHQAKAWPQFAALAAAPYGDWVVDACGVVALAGGVALQFRRSAQLGALAIGALYLIFALTNLPGIVNAPQTYNNWNSFFEQFSYVTGALIAYALISGGSLRALGVARIGRVLFGVCVASFTLEQAFYLQATADFVPKWIPPGAMFWALATTLFFALAAIALLSGRQTLLAARLLAAMLLAFGVVIWLPALFAKPHSLFTWSETAETFTIAAIAWMLADYLGESRSRA